MADSPTPTDVIDTQQALAVIADAESLETLRATLATACRFPCTEAQAYMLVDAVQFPSTIETPAEAEYGWRLLKELDAYRKAATAHYNQPRGFKTILTRLKAVVLEGEHADVDDVVATRKRINDAVVAWTRKRDHETAVAAAEAQRVADAEERRRRDEQAAVLQRIAEAETGPMRAVFHADAQAIADQAIRAAPVTQAKTAPPPDVSGHTRTNWLARIDDLPTLLRAYLDGQCHLDGDKIAEAILPHLNTFAPRLRHDIGKSFPGVSAYDKGSAVTRS